MNENLATLLLCAAILVVPMVISGTLFLLAARMQTVCRLENAAESGGRTADAA